MKKSMKILKGIMLTLLAAVCLAMAAAVFIHFGNNTNRETIQNTNERIRRERVEDAVEENETVNYLTENIMGQTAFMKPDGSDYWFYYPEIPEGTMPGDIVVLSASTRGFITWETDPNHADIEFTEESTDENRVYVSFIMPDEEVFIRAVYDDMLFNYDDIPAETEVFIFNSSVHEFGEYSVVTPNDLVLAPGMVGERYMPTTITFQGFPAGTIWSSDLVLEDILGMEFQQLNPNQVVVRTPISPTNADLQDTAAGNRRFTLIATHDNPDNPSVPLTTPFTFDVTIMARPVISVRPLPDGMVTEDYGVQDSTIIAASGVVGSDWIWTTNGTLPVGVTLKSGLPDNPGLIWLSGEPAANADGNYNFTVELRYNADNPNPNENLRNVVITSDLANRFQLKIIKKPFIDIPPRDFLDGMVGQAYTALYQTATTPVPLFTNLITASDVPTDTEMPGWLWSWNGFPPGMTFTGNSNSNATIGGIPSDATQVESTYLCSVTLSPPAGNPNLKGDQKEFSIKIWPRPVFDTANRLRDGMVGLEKPTDALGPEPDEEEYNAFVRAKGFPEDPEIKWAWADIIPAGIGLSRNHGIGTPLDAPENIRISGFPTRNGIFNIDLSITILAPTNPNINTAEIKDTFTVWIWPRTYLRTEIVPVGQTTGFVRRVDSNGVVEALPNPESPSRNLYRDRRAVMPGTVGQISTILSTSGFIRWEARAGDVRIDNNYGPGGLFGPDGDDGYVRIRIPGEAEGLRPDGIGATAAKDVLIHTIHARPPDVEAILDPGIGGTRLALATVNWSYSGGFEVAPPPAGQPTTIGHGPYPSETWIDLTGQLHGPDGRTGAGALGLTLNYATGSIRGIPLAGTDRDLPYTFNIGLILPGTMRIDKEYTMIIRPTPRVTLGDVNDDTFVDLVDLILLAKFLENPTVVTLKNPEAAIIFVDPLNPNRTVPDNRDLNALAAYFAQRVPLE